MLLPLDWEPVFLLLITIIIILLLSEIKLKLNTIYCKYYIKTNKNRNIALETN